MTCDAEDEISNITTGGGIASQKALPDIFKIGIYFPLH